MPVHKAPFIAALAAACALSVNCALAGLDQESNTDGFDPGAEAYRLGETRRIGDIARQLDTVYRMRWEYPYFPGEPPVPQPIGYESKQIAPNKWIYRPIYAEDVAPPSEARPMDELLPSPPQNGPAVKPQAPAPADAAPGDLIRPKVPLPPKPLRRGPREF